MTDLATYAERKRAADAALSVVTAGAALLGGAIRLTALHGLVEDDVRSGRHGHHEERPGHFLRGVMAADTGDGHLETDGVAALTGFGLDHARLIATGLMLAQRIDDRGVLGEVDGRRGGLGGLL